MQEILINAEDFGHARPVHIPMMQSERIIWTHNSSTIRPVHSFGALHFKDAIVQLGHTSQGPPPGPPSLGDNNFPQQLQTLISSEIKFNAFHIDFTKTSRPKVVYLMLIFHLSTVHGHCECTPRSVSIHIWFITSLSSTKATGFSHECFQLGLWEIVWRKKS